MRRAHSLLGRMYRRAFQIIQWHSAGRQAHEEEKQPAPVEAVSKVLVNPDLRVRLLVRLFVDAGLRRIESIAARTEDIIDDLTSGSLIVHGKGDKDRVIPASTALESELKRLQKGWIFPGQLEGRLCGDMAYQLVKDAAGSLSTKRIEFRVSNRTQKPKIRKW